MENAYGREKLFSKPTNRLKLRPPQAQASHGESFEDFGSTAFVTQADKLKQNNRNAGSSQTRKSSTSARNKRVIRDSSDEGGSDDEMDLLSQPPSEGPEVIEVETPKKKQKKLREKQVEMVKVNGKMLPSHPSYKPSSDSVLKKLKFTKNKSVDSLGTSSQSGASGSGLSLPKQNEPQVKSKSSANNDNPFDWDPHTDLPAIASPHNSKAAGHAPLTKPPQARTGPLNPRPRPLPARSANIKPAQSQSALPTFDSLSRRQKGMASSAQASSDPFRGLGATRVKKSKAATSTATVKKPTFPSTKTSCASSSLQSDSSDSDIEEMAANVKKQKRKPEDFPLPMSRSPSPAQQPKKRVPEEFPVLSPPRLSPSTHIQGFPDLSPLSKSQSKPTKTTSTAKQATAKVKGKPWPVGAKGKKVASLFTDEDDEDDDAGNSSDKFQPFPMSTQMLGDISKSPPIAGPSKAAKRRSTGESSDDSRPRRKKWKEDDMVLTPLDNYDFDEEDSIILAPGTDPRTLCPYCDTPLPSSPSPLLTRLLAATAKKSSRDPRPGNPLGRKAPLANFIAVCQRHRFESETLPEAEAKGWPKSIEWAALGKRIVRMREDLKRLIDDPGLELEFDEDGNLLEEEEDRERWGDRARSVFWREAMKEVKKKGSRAAAGVRGQFTNFEKTQPGYYGEMGSVIIYQTLYNVFPPTSLDPDLTTPLSANEFVQQILVPEVAVRLIMEDQDLTANDDIDKAITILRESSAYGVAMFPEDDGERNEGRKKRRDDDDDDLGVGDLIVMERARKRRKELEEEEQWEEQQFAEEEMRRKKEEQENRSTKATEREKKPKKRHQKQKEKEKDILTDVEGSEAQAVIVKPKPKPRPLMKTSTKDSIDTSDADMASQRNRTSGNSSSTSIGNPPLAVVRHSRSRQRSPSVSEIPQPTKASTKRSARSSSRTNSVDMDLCTSSSDSEVVDDEPIAVGNRSRRKRAPPQVEAVMEVVEEDRNTSPHRKSPLAPWNQKDEPDDNEDTPKPARSLVSSKPTAAEGGLPPLMLARQRRTEQATGKQQSVGQPLPKAAQPSGGVYVPWLSNMRARADSGSFDDVNVVNLKGNEHSWLLSDSSQSEVGSR